MSVVRRRCRCHKLFTFSSSSQEQVDQFQANLAQSIHGWRGLKFVQMKSPALFQGEIITNSKNILTKLKNLLLKNHFTYFNQTLHNTSWNKGDKSLFKWIYFPRGDNYAIAKIHWQNLKIFSRTTGPISTKLGTKHPNKVRGFFLLIIIMIIICVYGFSRSFLRWALWPMSLLL